MVPAGGSEYWQFAEAIGRLVPIRLENYKQQQMERRIRDLARKHQASSLQAFLGMLKADGKLLREFERHITINVSEFYRNPEAFEYLAEKVLPALGAGRRALRVWSAGCSNGGEPYTLAMLLHRASPHLRHSILATDIDRDMLAKAQAGKGYQQEDVRSLPAALRAAYLVQDGATAGVKESIARMVRFERLDLLNEQVNRTFDLIACRNVVIYFTDAAKSTLYQRFVDALQPGGFLFIGATETIGRADGFGLSYVAPCFYRKTG